MSFGCPVRQRGWCSVAQGCAWKWQVKSCGKTSISFLDDILFSFCLSLSLSLILPVSLCVYLHVLPSLSCSFFLSPLSISAICLSVSPVSVVNFFHPGCRILLLNSIDSFCASGRILEAVQRVVRLSKAHCGTLLRCWSTLNTASSRATSLLWRIEASLFLVDRCA